MPHGGTNPEIIIDIITTKLYEKMKKKRFDKNQFFLEDSNSYPVDFNNQSLTIPIHIIKYFFQRKGYFSKYLIFIVKTNNSCYVGQKHYSAASNVKGDTSKRNTC